MYFEINLNLMSWRSGSSMCFTAWLHAAMTSDLVVLPQRMLPCRPLKVTSRVLNIANTFEETCIRLPGLYTLSWAENVMRLSYHPSPMWHPGTAHTDLAVQSLSARSSQPHGSGRLSLIPQPTSYQITSADFGVLRTSIYRIFVVIELILQSRGLNSLCCYRSPLNNNC